MASPPRLYWVWVLGINAVTQGLFASIWLIVEANWVRKVRGNSLAYKLAIAHICSLPAIFIFAIFAGLVGVPSDSAVIGIITITGIVMFFGLWVATTLVLRSELESEPIGIPLGGVMSVLFGPVYFQYHLHDYDSSVRGSRAADGVLGLSRSNTV